MTDFAGWKGDPDSTRVNNALAYGDPTTPVTLGVEA